MIRKFCQLFLMGAIGLTGCGTFTVDIDYGDTNPTAALNQTASLAPTEDQGHAPATLSPEDFASRQLGWVTLTGTLRESDGVLMVGEGVMCQQSSGDSNGLCSGKRYTGADGRFSFGPVLLHASDTIILWAIPSNHAMLEIKRQGSDVWKQPDFEFVFSAQPTPSSIQLSAGDVGWITIAGTLRDGAGAPLAGETVTCAYVSQSPEVFGNRETNARGSFSCAPIFLRDADQVSVSVIAGGYAEQKIVRSGAEIREAPVFDFVFSRPVTATPALHPWATPSASPVPWMSPVPRQTDPETSDSDLLYQNPAFGFEFLYPADVRKADLEGLPAEDLLANLDLYKSGTGTGSAPQEVAVAVFANPDRLSLAGWLARHKNPDTSPKSAAYFLDASAPANLIVDNHAALIFHSTIPGAGVVPRLLIEHDAQIVSIAYLSRGPNPMRSLFLVVASSFKFTPVVGALVINQQLRYELDMLLSSQEN